jgi:hypothetical protein
VTNADLITGYLRLAEKEKYKRLSKSLLYY